MTITLRVPGTVDGACAGSCEHDACHEKRALARKLCAVCGLVLGYDAAIVNDDPARAAHAKCMDKVREHPPIPAQIGALNRTECRMRKATWMSAALLCLMVTLTGCAVGKKYVRGADGQLREVLVWGFDTGTLSTGTTAVVNSAVSNGQIIAGILGGTGVLGGGTLLIGKLWGLLAGKRKEDAAYDEGEKAAHKARDLADAAYDEGAARKAAAWAPPTPPPIRRATTRGARRTRARPAAGGASLLTPRRGR